MLNSNCELKKMILFTEKIKEIIFNHKKDIESLIKYLESSKRKVLTTTHEHENFCLYDFVVRCFYKINFKFPIKIISQESPDFVLIDLKRKKEIGFEHTQAASGQFEIAKKELPKRPKGSIIDLWYYSPGKISNKNSYVGITHPNEKINGPAWEGDQVEEEWAKYLNTPKLILIYKNILSRRTATCSKTDTP